MHSQLINTLLGEIYRHHTCACFQSDFDASSPGLDCFELGSNPRIWPPRWCQIMQILSSTTIHKYCRPYPPISLAVAQSRSDVFLLPAVPQDFLPTPGHQRLDCCGTR